MTKLLRVGVPVLLAIALLIVATFVWQAGSVAARPDRTIAAGGPVAAAVPASSGAILVSAGLASTAPDGTVSIDAGAVAAMLATVPDAGGAAPGYARDAFGPAWADVDHNGCDTRNDILRRDLIHPVSKPGTHGCVVASGTLQDPYTGRTIAFVRGGGTSEAVQIDHIVPLALAWRQGASAWSMPQREAFANDPVELLAVEGRANTAKSDSGPSAWLPAAADRCAYVARFVLVEHRFALTIAAADRDAIASVLRGC